MNGQRDLVRSSRFTLGLALSHWLLLYRIDSQSRHDCTTPSTATLESRPQHGAPISPPPAPQPSRVSPPLTPPKGRVPSPSYPMNTITYLTSLFNPSSRPSNSNSLTTPQPTQDHQGPSGRLDALAGDTIYLSARRGREGEGPQIRVSLESPAHLVGLLPPPPYGAAGGESAAGVDTIAEEDGESGPGSEGEGMGGGEKEGSDVYVSKREVEAEDLEGERKLLLRRDVKVWPVRVGVEIYIFLRHLLTLVGLLHPSLRDDDLVTPKSSPATTHDGDDVPSTPPTPITKPRLSFFLRRPSPPHPHPSPPPSTASTAPSRGPRRMSPKTLVLDLDETLIHSTSRPQAGRSNGLKVRVVEVVLEGRSTIYTVYKRPWVDFFLRKVRPSPSSISNIS